MNRPVIPDTVVAEALGELEQYLADRVAPLMVSDSMTVLARAPTERVARALHAWAGAQRSASSLPLTDYLFHALRKVQIVGEFRLVPPSLFGSFFARLQAAVVELAPEADRGALRADLARLGDTHTASVEQVELIHRPGEKDAETAARPSGSSASAAPPETPALRIRLPHGAVIPEHALRRLTLILDALSRLPPTTPPERRETLTAEAFAAASQGASSPNDMETQLAEFRSAGLVAHTYDVFRLLGENLPGWWAPGLPEGDQPDPQLAAMQRMISLAEDREEASRRFREMVENAVEQFNAGSLGRAVRMFDLALRMAEEGEVLPEAVEALRVRGHHSLDPERLRELLAGRERRGFPRVVLRFFEAFAPEAVLDELAGEPGRARRHLLLALVEAHGDDGRQAAFERLVRTPVELQDYYLFRNLVHLLRTIPRSVNATWEPEHEIARVIRLLVPDSPRFLLKEITAYLTAMRHPVAEQALVLFIDSLESAVLAASGREQAHGWAALDEVCAALAGCPSPRAWAAVIEHGLKSDPRLGGTLARLAELGRQDLATVPLLNSKLTTAAFAELPPELGAAPKATLQRLHYFVRALAGTRSGEARAFLEILAMRCPDSDVGRRARGIVRELSTGSAAGAAVEEGLAGDLDVFSLPALLQSLGDLQKTGTLTLLDHDGRPIASVGLERGRVQDASAGKLAGRAALFQLIERPFPGRFAFAPGAPLASGPAGSGEVIPLLLEGLRRQDELRRLEAIVPDDAVLVVKASFPPEIPGEDAPFMRTLWNTVAEGASVRDCEEAASVDAHRVRAALCYWVEAGALQNTWTASSEEVA